MKLRITITLCLIMSSSRTMACEGRCITPKKFEEMTCAEQRNYLEHKRLYRDLTEKCAPLIASVKAVAQCNEANDPKIQQSKCQRMGIANGAKNINAYCFDKAVHGIQSNGKQKAAFVSAYQQFQSAGCDRLDRGVSEFLESAFKELGKPAADPQIAACNPAQLTRSIGMAADAPCNPPMTDADLVQGSQRATGNDVKH